MIRIIQTVAAGLAVTIIFSATAAAQSAASIRGKVKEQKGKSQGDVLVKAVNAQNRDLAYETRSLENGDFNLTGLPGGDYILTFEKQGFKTFTTRRLTVPEGETLRLRTTIEIVREGEAYSLIRGAVLYDIGYTLPNARIQIERIDGGRKFKQETVSREGGEFAFRLRAEKATYRITASADGFETKSIELQIESDEVRNIAVNLSKK